MKNLENPKHISFGEYHTVVFTHIRFKGTLMQI